MKNLIKIAVLIAVISTSCEEQMIPIPEAPQVAEGRVILIEDMTGVNCPPCQGAIVLLEGVIEQNKGSVIVYGVHGKIQSEPIEDSKYDFRYEDAANLERDFNPPGKPAASFNRINIDGVAGKKVKIGFNTWQPYIDAELVKPQVAEVKINSVYNSETRVAEIEVAMIPLEDIDGEINVHVVITESHLIDPQKSQTQGVIKEFEHNHVFKKSLTGGIQGKGLTTDAKSGEIYRYNESYTLPDEDNGEWIAENMEVIAFVTATDRDGEVQQAAQIHLVE